MFTFFSFSCFAPPSGLMAAHDTQFFRCCVRSIPPFICGCKMGTRYMKKGEDNGANKHKHKCHCTKPPNDKQTGNTKKEKQETLEKPSQSQGPSGPHSSFNPLWRNLFLATKNTCDPTIGSNYFIPLSHSLSFLSLILALLYIKSTYTSTSSPTKSRPKNKHIRREGLARY